jgi:hypothetical protein
MQTELISEVKRRQTGGLGGMRCLLKASRVVEAEQTIEQEKKLNNLKVD